MAWEFSDDVEAYAERVWDLLTATPAENTVALTVVDNVRAGRQRSTGPMLFGWYAAGPTAGAVSMTPPYELLLAFVPDEGVDELVAAIRDRLPDLRGIHAEDTTAERFTAAWTAAGPLRATTKHRLRLYALDTLLQPTRSEGRARQAGEADYDVALSWFTEFQREVDAGPTANVASVVRDRIDNGLLWLGEDPKGTVVSLAARNRAVAGVARVGPVYTSPPHRRRGHGAAVTAACTGDALRREADRTVLFTDLANPTSNAIYQQIGYRPVRDHRVVHFG